MSDVLDWFDLQLSIAKALVAWATRAAPLSIPPERRRETMNNAWSLFTFLIAFIYMSQFKCLSTNPPYFDAKLMDSLLDPSRFRPDRLPSPAFMPRDDDFVELLRSADFDVRLQTLNRVINLSKRDPDWFTRFAKKGELFKNLDRILMDDRWEVQHQCIKFLVEAMPTFGNCLEYCVCYVMPNLIPKLGSSKITVRKVSVQAIQAFLKSQPGALGSVLKMLVNYLLTSPDRTTKSEVLQEVPALFITEVMQSNWFALVDCLTQWLATADKETIERIVVVTKKLEVYIGNDAFSRLLQNLSANQQRDYNKCSSNVTIVIDETEKRKTLIMKLERTYLFRLVLRLNHKNCLFSNLFHFPTTFQLKQIIEKITPEEVARLVPHLHSYLIGLSHVLTDLNFKVVVLALDVVRITVNRLKSHMEAHLQVVNILTAALMIISASKINFTAVINVMVPLLMDPKRRVRLAAFEQLSVVAYLMNGKIDPLLRAVRDAELRYKANGLYNAVMARIHRHLLPRIRYDGLIEYSTPPITDSSFNVKESELRSADNVDLLWILHAGGENHDRLVSPVSVVANIAKSLNDFRKESDKTSRYQAEDNHIYNIKHNALTGETNPPFNVSKSSKEEEKTVTKKIRQFKDQTASNCESEFKYKFLACTAEEEQFDCKRGQRKLFHSSLLPMFNPN
uniref:TOG domain-containing protein n=1 Tax=Heterorhabditis bacteriophora TaxID=37862 RepID=A0A1I7WQF1_HETBA